MSLSLRFKTVSSIALVDPNAWDRLVTKHNPFVSHSFLARLERSKSVGPHQTGWVPCHLLGFCAERLVVAVPLYQKLDSYGEYIFDWAWAHAAQQAGLCYYPKLVSAVPFTPATGPRLLIDPQFSLHEVMADISAALQDVALRIGASGVHLLFCEPHEAQALQSSGFCRRLSHQYHWRLDPQWAHFTDFLASLRSPSRKQIRKERLRAAEHQLTFSMRPVGNLEPKDIAALYTFYRQTIWEKGAQAYLTESFFAELGRFGTDAWAAMAHRGTIPIAGALYFRGEDALFGRYWGTSEALDALHFELCYYMPIEFCIQHKIGRFEAGAQGEHKLKRGLMPHGCHSAHLLQHQGLHAAVSESVRHEAKMLEQAMEELSSHGPFQRPNAAERSWPQTNFFQS